ncbi:MAG: hypothetical protein HC787_05660 [Nostocaceae cyanobacterium CSU_2_110]|nr:hypothetical protein [Richelia sp. SM1_7_0]NJN12666.1 hypothetical protein [Richelia sp. RM1_1_1]NJO31668.1 hypothetical protein [Richelia sp. SL_2_1]NJS16533.1 hypothetical protein [Nostocaceae cyanobacterium CSU_2_110]
MTRVERESMNFKLPKPLASALRKAASPQPGFTATDIVIRGLLHELGEIPGVEQSTETRLQELEKELQQLRSTIFSRDNTPTDSRTEEKLETLNNRVAQLEGALGAIQRNGSASNNRSRYNKYSGNPYNQSGRPAQLEPLDEQKLALRLNVNIPTLQEKHATLDNIEFSEWSKNRDRGKYMWQFNEQDKLYHPAK